MIVNVAIWMSVLLPWRGDRQRARWGDKSVNLAVDTIDTLPRIARRQGSLVACCLDKLHGRVAVSRGVH
jgi:hypothetical protein